MRDAYLKMGPNFCEILAAYRLCRAAAWGGLGHRIARACYTSDICAFISAYRLQIQPHNDALGLREVPNDFLDRRREPSNQCGNSNDLIALGQLRLLKQIDDFDAVLAVQFVLANLLEVGNRNNRIRRLARYVKPQYKKVSPAGLWLLFLC